jgi:hypothetical protein
VVFEPKSRRKIAMKKVWKLLPSAVALAIVTIVVAPVGATTLIRQSLENLVAGNQTIVVGEVVDELSYWNEDHTFILTEARISITEVLKGDVDKREIAVTLMGGQVADLTALIVGGAELTQGSAYVLFLSEQRLPGSEPVLTVLHHCQGVFEVRNTSQGLRAMSQAVNHPLHADHNGSVEAPGGLEGLPLQAMKASVREIAERQQGLKEIK